MRDKMRIENVEMGIIEREREMIHATILNQAIEESRVIGVANENSQLQYLSWYPFLRKKKLEIIFKKYVE